VRNTRLLVIACILVLTAVAVYGVQWTPPKVHKPALSQALRSLPGYRLIGTTTLSDDIFAFLQLDDYLFADFAGKQGRVNLFVGYYYTADKISAAHSPLACFPGQGWSITPPRTDSIDINGHPVRFAELTATLNDKKEYVLFWYQAGPSTTPQVYRNKIRTILNRFRFDNGENAFVRVTVTLTPATDMTEARTAALSFVRVFYPRFLDFISSTDHE